LGFSGFVFHFDQQDLRFLRRQKQLEMKNLKENFEKALSTLETPEKGCQMVYFQTNFG
jgi:hypothetical protein